jgi:hypothetical protein
MFVLAIILSFSDVKATLVSVLAPRCDLLLIKLSMVLDDILFMFDTDLSKSLNVLIIVTVSSILIYPSMFFIIRLTALSSVSVRSHLILRFRHRFVKSVIDSSFFGLVLVK